MGRTLIDSHRWMEHGQRLISTAVRALDEDAFAQDSLLPGWSRRHLVAHIAGNADALSNLVDWAATGVDKPMYASSEERAAGIARGARLPIAELIAWQERSAAALAENLARLSDEQWSNQVRTMQGRVLPATEIPWLRAREVMVHAVDLDLGIGFADLPADFLTALVEDIRAKRGDVPAVDGALPEVAAWLAGRRHALVDAPDLGPWL